MLTIFSQVNGQRRIDWVGEEGHRQPQDPVPRSQNERYQTMNDNLQGPSYQNEISDDDDDDDVQKPQQPDDVQTIQQPESDDFGKGTYLEFIHQKYINP